MKIKTDIIAVAFVHVLFAVYALILIQNRELFSYMMFLFLFMLTTIVTRKVYKKYTEPSEI